MFFLSRYLLGILEDNVSILTAHYAYTNVGVGDSLDFLHWQYNLSQPFYSYLFYFVSLFINPVLTFNLFIIVGFLLNIYFFNKLFSNFFDGNDKRNRFIRYVLTLIAGVSPFIIFQSRAHIELMAVWVLALGIHLLLNLKTLKGGLYFLVLCCLLLSVLIIISISYYGY